MPSDDAKADPRQLVLSEMRKQTALLGAILLALNERRTITPAHGAAANAASDAGLDGPHGDPVIKAKSPKDWTGDNMIGRKFSECPAAYLDLVASRLDYFAGREEDAKKAGYNRLDASRARGWAARLRDGWTAPVAVGRVHEADTEPTW